MQDLTSYIPFHAYQIWLGMGMLLAVGEIFTAGFYLLCLALACLLPSLIASLSGGLNLQITGFATASVGLLFFHHFYLRHRLASVGGVRTNSDAMVGVEAEVVEAILPGGRGRVRIGGEIWSARAEGTEGISPGSRVFIQGREGLELSVSAEAETKKEGMQS